MMFRLDQSLVDLTRFINERAEYLILGQPSVYMHCESKSYWEKAQMWNKRESYSSTDAIARYHHPLHDCLHYPSVHLRYQILCFMLRHLVPVLLAIYQQLPINNHSILAKLILNSIFNCLPFLIGPSNGLC